MIFVAERLFKQMPKDLQIAHIEAWERCENYILNFVGPKSNFQKLMLLGMTARMKYLESIIFGKSPTECEANSITAINERVSEMEKLLTT